MKKAFALILSLVLILLPMSAVLVSADPKDDSEVGYTLDGTTFTVYTPAGLNAVATLINGSDYDTYKTYNITLANDLEFVVEEGLKNFTPIGGDKKPYSGTFDGAGHTIKGLQTDVGTTAGADRYRALFGQAGNCTIKNLTIADSKFTGYEYVSALVGAATGWLKVTNVHVRNTIIQGDLDKGNNTAGLCGRFFQAAEGDSLFENCTVQATISAFKNVAGICAGEASSGNMTITIRNCVVAGTYETKCADAFCGAAGIFGFANGKVKVTIENCISIADLKAASGEFGSMLSMLRRSDYEIKNSIVNTQWAHETEARILSCVNEEAALVNQLKAQYPGVPIFCTGDFNSDQTRKPTNETDNPNVQTSLIFFF